MNAPAAIEGQPGTAMTKASPPPPPLPPARPRVVIVGAGFGGLTAAKSLAFAEAEVFLVDKRNYHLFQPLLYQVATAGLSPAQIAQPTRAILRRQKNAHTRLGKVSGIDLAAKAVLIGEERISYDQLIIATGARHAYFGRDDWEPFAPGLKKIDDATLIRRRLLLAFEHAEAAKDPLERKSLLTFVIIGGGPTGVEMAGAIVELARHALAEDFRAIDPRDAHVILVEAGPRLLPAMPEKLSSIAKRSLEKLGVQVILDRPVTDCSARGVVIGDEQIEARTIIWAAGVAASPAARWLNAEKDRAGRVKVEPDLTIPGHPEVFVIGDTALVTGKDGKPVPGTAPAAKQMGRYVAKVIRARLTGAKAPGPFRYRHAGNLATIGRSHAVVDFGRLRFSGWFAWVFWSVAHIYFLIGFKNRLAVAWDWLWAYFTFERGARLITGEDTMD